LNPDWLAGNLFVALFTSNSYPREDALSGNVECYHTSIGRAKPRDKTGPAGNTLTARCLSAESRDQTNTALAWVQFTNRIVGVATTQRLRSRLDFG